MSVKKPQTVDDWLDYIEALHPKSIDMGLERVSTVAKRLNLKLQCPVITVAGTNGKGSTCAMLSHLYQAAGYQVASYTSPHLMHYSERITINHVPIIDRDLCQAFETVEQARQDTALTYYEMGTLAALWHFMQLDVAKKLDVVILEVGLGGRLDATNIIDADCAIVTNIALDHMEYLGDTREKIGAEKAGVYKNQQIAICGDTNPPESLLNFAEKVHANLKLIGQDFTIKRTGDVWHYKDNDGELSLASLGLKGNFQRYNAAVALYAVRALGARLPVSMAVQENTLATLNLTGRFQYLQQSPDVILDVAHNPQAAESLVDNLRAIQDDGSRFVAVFSMLADKDIEKVVKLLAPHIETWHMCALNHPRGASLNVLQKIVVQHVELSHIKLHANLDEALETAYKKASINDKIIVFGSFFTVAAALHTWQQHH